ncbi:MAG: TraB/GumN family protein [Bacteroidota bacterium]
MNKTFLWQLHASQPSYLLGSMHIKDARVFKGVDVFKTLIESVDAYAGEAHLDDLRAQSFRAPIRLDPTDSIIAHLSPKQYTRMRNILKKAFQIDVELFQALQPAVITGMIDESIFSKDLPFAFDEILWRHAQSNGKTLHGIESVEQQFQVFREMPFEQQLKSLHQLSKNVTNYRQSLNKMAQLYQAGEIAILHKVAKKSLGSIRKLMLYDRNIIMAERIFDLMQEESTFFTIGAGHLWGAKGVLRLLKKRGVDVRGMDWPMA